MRYNDCEGCKYLTCDCKGCNYYDTWIRDVRECNAFDDEDGSPWPNEEDPNGDDQPSWLN